MKIFESKSRTVSEISESKYRPPGCVGGVFFIDITAVPGAAPSVVFTVQYLDQTSGKWFADLASVALTAVGVSALYIYPTFAAVANSIGRVPIAEIFRVKADHGNANAVTYSVGFEPFN